MAFHSFLVDFVLWAQSTVGAYGYLSVFLASLIGSATIILPTPVFAFIFAMGSILNPWLVGILAGVGAGIGELTGYAVGRGGGEVARKKYGTYFKKAREWADKRGMFLIIIIFNATPLPADVIGLLVGVMRYNIKRFLLAAIIGKIIQNTYIALAGAYSFKAIQILFGAG